jgi:vacuolar-type H+-ATPase subunit E/Vma4
MGIREMLDEIKLETLNEANNKIEEAKKKANEMIISKINELEKCYDEKRKAFETELASMKSKLYGKVQMELMKEEETKKATLYNNLIENLIDEVIERIKKDEKKYEELLVKLIEKAKEKLGNKKIKLSFSFEDEKLFEKIAKKVKDVEKSKAVSIKGGVICFTDTEYVDGSFDSIFNNSRQEILKIIVDEIGE